MRRFDYEGNDEYQDDIDQFFDEEDDEEYMGDASLVEIVHTNLFSLDLNRKLLIAAIKVAEKSFFWKFWPMEWKLKAISDTYHTLDRLVDDNDEEEE